MLVVEARTVCIVCQATGSHPVGDCIHYTMSQCSSSERFYLESGLGGNLMPRLLLNSCGERRDVAAAKAVFSRGVEYAVGVLFSDEQDSHGGLPSACAVCQLCKALLDVVQQGPSQRIQGCQ